MSRVICMEEVSMNRLLLVAAAVLVFTGFRPDLASAQRGGMRVGGFGGFHGAAIGGGFRGAAIGGGFRGAMIGGGFRTAAAGAGWRPSWGVGTGWGWRRGLGWPVAAGAGWRPGWGVRTGWGWRRGWGWPVAAGLAIGGLGYYGYHDFGYSNSNQCLAWNGWRWVNICYQPFDYW